MAQAQRGTFSTPSRPRGSFPEGPDFETGVMLDSPEQSKRRERPSMFTIRGFQLYLIRTERKILLKHCSYLVLLVLLGFAGAFLRPTIPLYINAPTLLCSGRSEDRDHQTSAGLLTPPVLFSVTSNCRHTRARKAIRETWGTDAVKYASKVLFFVGHHDECDEVVAKELQDHGDVVVLSNVPESYGNLPLKTLSMFEYVAKHHGDDFKFIAKVDDDVFVDHYSLFKLVAQAQSKRHPAEYMGFFHNGTVPVKKPGCKWYDENYDMDLYPPYAGGMFYLVSARIVRWVASNAHDFALWANEDSSFGTWVQSLDPVIFHFPQVWPSRVYAVHQVAPPAAIHVEWATGQGVQKGWEDDGPVADMMYKMAKHQASFNVPFGQCADSLISNFDSKMQTSYHETFGELYTSPTGFSESRMEALKCRASETKLSGKTL